MTVRKHPLVILGFNIDPFNAGDFLEAGHVDLVIEVADVSDDGVVLHPRHVLRGDDVAVPGGGNEDVGLSDDTFQCLDLESFHRRLQRANGVDFRDHHARALAA